MVKRKSCIITVTFTSLTILLLMYTPSHAQLSNCSFCHQTSVQHIDFSLMKPASVEERAIGLMDKGQVFNYLGNYGVLSNYLEYFNDAIRWPAAANEETQYCFGLGLVVAVRGNVITSVVGGPSEKVDWVPKDGSRGKLFSGDVTAPPPDETPFLAMSDNPETWPQGYFDEQGEWINTPGNRHWPGHFRIDIDPTSPTFGQEIEGEFVSDRDIYCVFNDDDNFHPNGPVGVEVEQTAYNYGRPYAEDMLFWDFTIHNKSGKDLDSVYVGYYAIFRPDYDNEDYINIIDSTPEDDHPNGDFVYVWDVNNTKDGAWENDPTDMGIIGLNVLETPKNLGVTDFHFFNREVAPKTDDRMWAVISSNPNDTNLELPQAFFHGLDRRIDDTNPDSLKKYFPEGAPINFFIMTGPIDLKSDERVKSSVALVMGNAGTVPDQPDTNDLMNNLRTTQKMYQRKFQGSGPPKTPVVQGVSGDGKVRLVWDSEAEKSVDALTGENDFEGYKIYRSTDKGKTWGTAVTDFYGNVIGYRPVTIFDKIDGIKGPDPAFNQSLGEDSGLRHSYVDSNLINGVEYWYCVTAYDHGNQNPDSLEQSYQSALGHSVMESHTVAVVPGVLPQNFVPPDLSPNVDSEGALSPIGGPCQGIARIEIVDPEAVVGDDYAITFSDSVLQVDGADTNFVLGFNLIRISKDSGDSTALLYRHPFSDDSGDNLPVVDGFRLTLQNSPSGIEFIGWTRVNGDTCTYDWYTEQRTESFQEVWEEIGGFEDFKIVIVDSSQSSEVVLTDGVFGHITHSYIRIPVKVYVVTDPDNPIDVSQYTEVFDLRVQHTTSELLGPLGWDLIPGGAGYNPTGAGNIWPDILALNDGAGETSSHVWLKTQNGPATATPPSVGDEFTIKTYKPFRKEIHYEFSTQKAAYSTDAKLDLDQIRVVPDPYIVSNAWETNQFGKKLMFNHLPDKCTISIYTVAGDHIRTIQHDNNKGYEFWDMRTYNDQFIAFGLYVFVVDMPNGQQKVGRFLVIK